jgi:hypothetical protein
MEVEDDLGEKGKKDEAEGEKKVEVSTPSTSLRSSPAKTRKKAQE